MDIQPTDRDRDTACGLLPNTYWSVVLRARDGSESALEGLCQRYRAPLITWLRIRRYSPPDAEDLIQGFFARLLDRDFLSKVGQEKGRFRTFLLTCLRRYLIDEAAKQKASKRGGGRSDMSLQEQDEDDRPLHDPSDPRATPDVEFDRAWARTVLANASRRLAQECARSGHEALYTALEPVMLCDQTASPYREIGNKLGKSEGAVKVAAHRIRGRLKGLIRDEVQQTVSNQQDWEEELRYLVSLFST